MFKVRKYASEEQYDIAKFLDFRGDVYDVINSPFLRGLKELPVERYYPVESGNEDLDIISEKVYGIAFLAFHIQFYNGLTTDYAEEGTVLKLFSLEDLNKLCDSLYLEDTD